jgi:SAM-dependent methyltransferase
LGDFSAVWLALRERADTAARSEALLPPLTDWLTRQPRAGPLEVLDLGCGTGANPRWLAPRLGTLGGVDQAWVCVDHDPELLAALPSICADWAAREAMTVRAEGKTLRLGTPWADWTIETHGLDLAGGPPANVIPPRGLVTATALLDLVSEDWLESLLAACAARAAPLLATLIYDGRVALSPRLPLDGPVIGLVNGHQRRDKGFGPALGPSAAGRLGALGTACGFSVHRAESDWMLDHSLPELQLELIAGWADAAREQAATAGETPSRLDGPLADWVDARRRAVEEGRSTITVGHQDLLLLPAKGGSGE